MDAQTTFYIVGSIFMLLCILLLLGIAILMFYVKKKIGDVEQLIEKRIDEVTALSVKPIKKVANIAQSILPPANKKAKRKR